MLYSFYLFIYLLKMFHFLFELHFPFFLLIHLSIRDKKGESIPECFFISL